MRRILHLRTISGKGGGPEKTLLFTPRFLGEDYTVRVAYIRPEHDPEYDMPRRAQEMGVTLIDIPERGPADPRTLARLAREIREFQPELLHAHDYKTNILSVLLGRWFGVPAITTLHGYGIIEGRLAVYRRLERWALRRMAHIVSVSPDLDEYLGTLEVPDARRTIIDNAIDIATYRRQTTREDAKRKLGFSPQRMLIGAVGRLQPEKAFGTLIQSAADVLAQGLEFDLVIVGEGPRKTELQRKISDFGLESKIHLLGHRSDVIELYEAMDLYVLSSIREASPNALLEAMAMEVPVIATRVAGTPRIVRDGVSGLLINPNDPPALSNAMLKLLCSSQQREEFAFAGRRTIEQDYSFTRRMQKMRVVYDKVLGPSVDQVIPGPIEPEHSFAGR